MTRRPAIRSIPSAFIGIGEAAATVGAFVIFLREGIEGSMLVAMLVAYLRQIRQTSAVRDVYLGVAAALAFSLGGGIAAYVLVRGFVGSRPQMVFETVTYVLATVVLTYMTFWMRRQSRSVRGALQRQADAAIDGGSRFAVAAIAFQAVGREGLEAAVLLLAIAFSASPWSLLAGAAAGVAGALVTARLIYGAGMRLPLSAFFAWLGAILFVVAGGLLADAVQNLQALGWLQLGTHVLWNTGGILREDSVLGDLLHGFVGYAAAPSVLQVAVYAVYLAVVLCTLFAPRRVRA